MNSSIHTWYDTRVLTSKMDRDDIFSRISRTLYTGIVLYTDTITDYVPRIPGQIMRLIKIADEEEMRTFLASGIVSAHDVDEYRLWVIISANIAVLAMATQQNLATCFYKIVEDEPTLQEAIEIGKMHSYLMVRLCDPTNIPLELVIASLQSTSTAVIKEIHDPENIQDAIVSLGVMEVGAEGVMYSPTSHALLDQFLSHLVQAKAQSITIDVATMTRSVPIGMGYRSCVDVVTLFSQTEGMLIGSTSQGGVLCCAEVFFLPYMELRPFRVNAGGVHSYIYGINNHTNYLSELRAGSQIMVVTVDGNVRQAPVGRVKTELRPMRLIEAEFASGEKINVILQDDWHVRVFSSEGTPCNITKLKPGDKILGHLASPGRHVGIKVDETILEL